MKRNYPYLHDKYFMNTEVQENVVKSVLTDIQNFANQRQYVRLTLLTWEENPIRDIEGEVSSGNISKVATSPVRRTGDLSIAVDAGSYNTDDAEADFAINKKIYLELGVRNDTDKYEDYPIFWFPQGIFFISSFSINSSSTGTTNINISLKDKMAMLNGDVGGTLPATVTFDQVDTQLPDGSYATKKVCYYRIIQELVSHFGKESLSNILIEDVPLRIRRIMQWTGANPLYLIWEIDSEGKYSPLFSLEPPNLSKYDYDISYDIYYTGENVGYVRDDFVPVDELVGAAGDTVMSILDKIIQSLGNYEYFYDVYGMFHFREIKNYLNHSLGNTALAQLSEKDYLTEINNEKSIFTFSDETLLSSITVTPLYENIKNDFIIDGKAENETTGISHPVRYHLAIDKKPTLLQQTDERESIIVLRDRSKQIAQLSEDINDLQRKADLAQNEINNILIRINSLEKQKEQRYPQRKKYGDELKYQLQMTLGDWAIPNNQLILEVGLNKEDFYSDQIDNLIASFKISKKIADEYLSSSDKQLQRIVEKVDLISLNIIDAYSEAVYQYLTPEGFWKLIKSGILQKIYDDSAKTKYNLANKLWIDSYKKLGVNDENAFKALPSGKQNEDTGYKKITNTFILTNEKKYVQKPQLPQSTFTNWWKDIGKNLKLSDIVGWNSVNKIYTMNESYIKNIYTDYFSYLTLNGSTGAYERQEKGNLKDISLKIKNLENQLIALEKLKTDWAKPETSIVKWYSAIWDEANQRAINGTTSNSENKNNYTYTALEGKIAEWKEELNAYRISLKQVNANLKLLQDKRYSTKIVSIYESLRNAYINYITEVNRIKELEDLKNQYQELKNEEKFENLNKAREPLEIIVNRRDETGEIFDDDSLSRNLTWPTENNYNKESIVSWYNTWIREMGNVIQMWIESPGTKTKPNPHAGQRYYAKYDDRTLILYEEGDTGYIKAGFVKEVAEPDDEGNLVYREQRISDEGLEIGNFNLVYAGPKGEKDTYYYWDGQMYKPLNIKGIYKRDGGEGTLYSSYYVYDWRTLLYLEGKYAQIDGTDEGHYYQELDAFWPQTYDLINQWFYGQGIQDNIKYNPTRVVQGTYFLDFIDSASSKFGEWGVNNIGRRSDVVSNDKINCLFEAEIPNVNIINATHLSAPINEKSLEQEMSREDLIKESRDNDEPFSQVDDEIFDHLATGGYQNGAYEQIKYELYLHTTYQKSISLSAIPVFYLEPNSRIKITDETTNTYGDFILQSISLTLGPGANMSISASEATERF